MAFIPQARASALPHGVRAQLAPSARRRVRARAAEHGGDTAFLVGPVDALEARSWSQVEDAVERAAAGLVRSGLRPDQVVLSLLPAGHGVPELDVALRAVGAVVVHVSPEVGADELARRLAGADVRLVVCEDESELQRLVGLPLPSAMVFALGGGRGWDRLLELGAERLVMDPDAVDRADRVVDPAGTTARVLRSGAPLGRVADADRAGELVPGDGVALLCGDLADPFVQQVRDAHLESGGALLHVAAPADLPAAMAAVRPSVLALGQDAVAAMPGLLATAAAGDHRRRRPGRARAADPATLRAWAGGNLASVVAADVPDVVQKAFTAGGARVSGTGTPALLPADLPVPPPVVLGDAADLPRRARREPAREFQLETERETTQPEPDESAFVLPSLSLIGGESFLDKLLLAKAREAAS
ncbi:AMP-binding protein [Nocardioides renjunii]|uniref:AMP-binding protein n=1 Tax=Nocardioides renjunii TaxID=3095075 RepID=UPI002AFF529A|nr:AMP-binding protein [Nocardioides sp. S-34]WQQ22914.1 AMP-binding protein [Nocardioides sp. S-34]